MDRECNQCGASEWEKFYEQTTESENQETDETRFMCESCGEEGRKFSHKIGATVYSGGIR